jgi:hypothetical protein
MKRFKRAVVVAALIGALGAAAAAGAGWKWSAPVKGHALSHLPQRHSHPIQPADGWTWD